MFKCDNCGDPVDSCRQCGYDFEEGDVTYEYLTSMLEHFHDLDCIQEFLEITEGSVVVRTDALVGGG